MTFALPANMPILSLSTPIGHNRYGSIELNEGLLKHWLQRLPLNNPIEVAHRYLEALDLFNQNEMFPALRIKLLDLYRGPVNEILFSLTPDRLTELVPIAVDRQSFINDMSEVLNRIAIGYKIVVNEAGKQNDKLSLNTLGQLAIHRSIEQLSFLAIHEYKFYRKLPQRLFRELHQLYLLSVSAELNDHIPFMNKQLKADVSYKQLYCQFLLLSVANPYGLGRGEILRTYKLMGQLVPAARLTVLTEQDEAKAGHFYVNCLSDKTPTPAVLPLAEDRSKPPTLILDTKSILVKVADLFEQADKQGGHHPASSNIRLLRKVLPYLNTSYQRKQARIPVVGDKETYIAVGLPLIHEALTEGEELPIENHQWLNSKWEVLNKNDYGYLVQKRKVRAIQNLKIGDFVGIFEQSEITHKLTAKLASIRWLRTDDFEQTKIGLKFIPGEAIPVFFTVENSEKKQAAFLLPEIARTQQPASLITSCGVFVPQRVLQIKMGKKKFKLTIKIEKLIDKNASFERFTFRDAF